MVGVAGVARLAGAWKRLLGCPALGIQGQVDRFRVMAQDTTEEFADANGCAMLQSQQIELISRETCWFL